MRRLRAGLPVPSFVTDRRPTRFTKPVLIASGALTILGGAVIAPAIPALADHFSDVPNAQFQARLLLSMHAAAIVLLAPLLGAYADRLGLKRVFVSGIVIFGTAGTAGAILPTLPMILASRAIMGIGMAMIMITSVPMIASFYSGREREQAIGWQMAAATLGGAVFSLATGALAEKGWQYPFLAYLIALPLAVATALLVPRAQTHDDATAPTETDSPPPRPVLLHAAMPLSLSFLAQIAMFCVPLQVPFLFAAELGLPATYIGGVMALLSVMMALNGMVFGHISGMMSRLNLAGIGFALIGVGFLGLFALGTGVGIFAGVAVAAAGLGLLLPTFNAWVVSMAPPARRGRYIGVLTTSIFAGQFVSPLVLQPVVAAGGAWRAFEWAGTGAMVVAIACLVMQRVLHTRAAAPAPARR